MLPTWGTPHPAPLHKYSSTQYIDIINILLNSFQLKLVKFTKISKNEQNKNKKPLQAHHVTTKTGQKKQQ